MGSSAIGVEAIPYIGYCDYVLFFFDVRFLFVSGKRMCREKGLSSFRRGSRQSTESRDAYGQKETGSPLVGETSIDISCITH